MEFIAPAGIECCRYTRDKVRNYGILATSGRKHEILIEWRFQYSRIRNPQNGVAGFNVVSDPYTRFGLTVKRQSVVEVTANTYIENPVSFRDCILHIQCEFFHI